MKFLCYVERLNRMNHLIQNRTTGSPSEFAAIIGISRTRLYEILDELRSTGAPIVYDKQRNTFLYEFPFEILATYSARQLTAKEEKKHYGGTFFSHEYLFSGRCAFNFTFRKLTGC
jgi:predicted DNA-binding transcriptional regulator YafY